MSFLNLLSKKNVPDELPALVSEEINKKLDDNRKDTLETNNSEISEFKKRELELENNIRLMSDKNALIENSNETLKSINTKENIYENASLDNKNEEKEPLKKYPSINKDSFFIKLQENLSKEMDNLDKLEDWYNNKLLPKDSLSEMKNYWEKQNSLSIIQAFGKDYQDNITKKINLLQELEKDWQNAYINLIEKEERIKEEEKELKKILAEFIEFCKRRVKKEKKVKKETV